MRGGSPGAEWKMAIRLPSPMKIAPNGLMPSMATFRGDPVPVGSSTISGVALTVIARAHLPSGERLHGSPSPRRTAGDPSVRRR